mmetsp:Transcript_28381/g.73040  ORF Transcript_28381/g.73040 Transcript_28381/m.73040 type:complete len:161 (-) Transcript_28381:232-714(-)
MAALGLLTIGGLLSLRPLLVPVPTLSASSTLVFLESLTGAFEASRAADSFGGFAGSLLFLLAALHALWLAPQARSLYARVAAAARRYLPLEPALPAPPYARLDEPAVDLEAPPTEPLPLSAMSPPPVAVAASDSPFNPYEHEPFVASGTNPSPGTMKMST